MRGLHELQVVNDDEPVSLRMAQFAARLRASFQNGQARRVVDVHIKLRERVRCIGDGAPIPFGDESAADLREAYARLGTQDTLHKLARGHFQGEEGDRRPRLRRVHGEVQCERRLADAGPCGKDDQVTRTQAVEQVVCIFEARRNTRHMAFLLRELRDFLERLGEQGVNARKRRGHALLRDVEECFLGGLHDLVQIVGGVIGKRVDLCRRKYELAQDGRALHDVGMVLPVGERERVVRKVDEVRLAADRLELPRRVERIGKRNLVDGDAADVQVAYRLEDDAMGRTEEVLGLQLQHQLLDSLGVEHACCQNGLLRFDVLGQWSVLRR